MLIAIDKRGSINLPAVLRKELEADRSEDRAAREALEKRISALEERVAA